MNLSCILNTRTYHFTEFDNMKSFLTREPSIVYYISHFFSRGNTCRDYDYNHPRYVRNSYIKINIDLNKAIYGWQW